MTTSEDAQPYAVITVTDLYLELREMHAAITRVESTLKDSANRIEDHETRIRSLERRTWLFAGAAAVIGGSASKILPLFGA